MKKKLITLSSFGLSLMPMLAFAAPAESGICPPNSIGGIICKVAEILRSIIPVIIALGVVYFIWGVITFVIADDEEAKSAGRNRMIYGIIGLAVIVGMWALVGIITNTFGLNTATNVSLPAVPMPSDYR